MQEGWLLVSLVGGTDGRTDGDSGLVGGCPFLEGQLVQNVLWFPKSQQEAMREHDG